MKTKWILFVLGLAPLCFAQDYALDDAHNHDGTHVQGQIDCGSNYMLPGETARLGSHSFLILGEDGPNHLLLDHRSGTPPHNYQFILRVKVDANEMATHRKLLRETKISLPAVTTIYFDKAGKQLDRTFFCLSDLKKIFGPEQQSQDKYDKLFPIRASWQKDADFEGAFPIKETVVPEDPLTLERKDVELVLYRYLPSYLEQSGFRKMLKKQGSLFTSTLSDAPIKNDDTKEAAIKRSSYIHSGAFDSNGESCPADYYLKNVKTPKTKHKFLLLSEMGKNSVLAVHLYDQSPQNFQTALSLELSDEEMLAFRKAKKETKTPLLFSPTEYFCMSEIRALVSQGSLELKGAIYKDSEFEEFKLGQPAGELKISSKKVKVLTNRTLQSLMNPQAVARDVFGFVDLKSVNSNIYVQALYSTDWNFIGKSVEGYQANRCFLTNKAAKALSQVQNEIAKSGYSLLVFDCYRPQRAVSHFVLWTKDAGDTKMQSHFYPEEPKMMLFQRGYIDAKSGHSRGSTVDLTIVRNKKFQLKDFLSGIRNISDCRKSGDVEQFGLVDMGTTFDCFSELAATASPLVSEEVRKNRQILKSAMEKQGFTNYPKEWWHFVMKDEPYKKDYFDFEVQ